MVDLYGKLVGKCTVRPMNPSWEWKMDRKWVESHQFYLSGAHNTPVVGVK